MVEARLVVDLKRALTAAHHLLAEAAALRQVKKDGGLNIEGLAMRADRRALMLGFRSPLLDGRAIIACIDNPDAMFDAGRAPQLAGQLPASCSASTCRDTASAPWRMCRCSTVISSSPVQSVASERSLPSGSGVAGTRICRSG